MQNYRSLIVAGLGSIGGALFRLTSDLPRFDAVFAVDKEPYPFPRAGPPAHFVQGDVRDEAFLSELLASVPLPALFLNACQGVDNVALRQRLARHDAAYIDTCAGSLPGEDEVRFSRLMPYAYTPIPAKRPHWLCWGINPGLVEVVARLCALDRFAGEPAREVAIFEHDQLRARLPGDGLAVSWSPSGIIEEIMLSPSFYVAGGRMRERDGPGTDGSVILWEDRPVASRLVGHEELWNLWRYCGFTAASFHYGFNEAIMDALGGEAADAERILRVPPEHIELQGKDRVAIRVSGAEARRARTLLWEIDHAETRRRHGINAVQYQTCKSLLLAVHLLQQTRYGSLPGTYCASSIPIAGRYRDLLDGLLEDLGIRWQKRDGLVREAA